MSSAAPCAVSVAKHEDAARLAGAGPLTIWRKINLPLLAPAIALAMIAIFAEGLSDFGMAATIARNAHFELLTYGIYAAASDYPVNFPLAGTQALILLCLVVMVVLADRLLRRQTDAKLISGRSRPAKRYNIGAWRWLATGAALLVTFLAFLLPLAAIAVRAFAKTLGRGLAPHNFTTAHMLEVLTPGTVASGALVDRLAYAILAAILACAAALLLAVEVDRSTKVMRPLVLTISLGAVAIPGIVLGFGYILLWNRLPRVPRLAAAALWRRFSTDHRVCGCRTTLLPDHHPRRHRPACSKPLRCGTPSGRRARTTAHPNCPAAGAPFHRDSVCINLHPHGIRTADLTVADPVFRFTGAATGRQTLQPRWRRCRLGALDRRDGAGRRCGRDFLADYLEIGASPCITFPRRSLMTATLSCKAISKSLGGKTVLANLDIEIAAGEVVSLLGASGSGKTTLLRAIAGLHDPDEGTIRLDGKVIWSRSSSVPAEKRRIGMVFQDYALWPHMTVEGNLAFGLKARKIPQTEIRSRIAHALEVTRLTSYAERHPAELSGGQQQRVAIAALSCRTSGVDAVRRAALQPRCRTPRGHAGRDDGTGAPRGHHGDLRHPRPVRGDGGIGPHRGDARGQDHPIRHAGPDLRRSCQCVRCQLHRRLLAGSRQNGRQSLFRRRQRAGRLGHFDHKERVRHPGCSSRGRATCWRSSRQSFHRKGALTRLPGALLAACVSTSAVTK